MTYGGKWGDEDWGQSPEVRRLGVRLAMVEEKVDKTARDGVGLGNSSFDRGTINQYDGGTIGSSFGQQFDGTNGVATLNGPVPPRAAAPTITTVTGGVNVRWNGTWDPVNDSSGRPIVAPTDFKGVEVHVARDDDFSTDDFDTVVGPMITSARGGDVFVPWGDTGTPLYARLVVRATTGKKSPASATAGPVNSGISMDSLAPKAPAQPTLASTTVLTKEGIESGIVTVTWVAPTQNENNTPLTDLAGYLVQWRYTGQTDWFSTTTTGTTLRLNGVVPGLQYEVKVAAFDKTNNYSPWSPTASQMAVSNDAPPAKPNPPVVTNYLGQLRIEWGGLLNGNLPPVDFRNISVFVSATSGFTPSDVTKVADMTSRGVVYATAPYGSTYYVRFVAYDNRGNASVASDQSSGSTKQVVNADIFDGAVGTSKLADLVVTTAKIADLAVNDAKIGSLSVGKLTAGTLSADVIMSGRFATALSGARTEMNSAGFQKFRADGTKAVSITATETLLTGLFKTAETGRRIELGVAGDAGIVNFIGPNNINGFVKSYTEPNSVDSIQFGMTAPSGNNFLWNRINYNDIGIASYQAIRHIFSMTNNGEFAVEFFPNQLNYDPVNPANHGGVRRFTILEDGLRYRDNSNRLRMDILNGAQRFYPGGESNGSFELIDNGGTLTNQSARLLLLQPNAGGVMIKSISGFIELRNRADNAFSPIRASAFEVNSDAGSKGNIEDATLNGLATLRNMRVRKYTVRRPNVDDSGWHEKQEIGLVAQEAPPEVQTSAGSGGALGVDLYQLVAVLIKGGQELAERVRILEQRGLAFEQRLAALEAR